MGGLNDAIVTEVEPRFLLYHSSRPQGMQTTKTLEFDSHTICDSSSFNLGWEEFFEDSPAQAEERPPDLILDAIDDRSASVLSKSPNHRYLRLRDLWVGVLPHNEPD